MMTSRRSCQQKCTVKHIYAGLALESSLGGYPFEKIIPTPDLFQSTDFKVPLSGLLLDGLAPFGPDRLVECPHLRSGSDRAVVPVALAGCTCSTIRYVLLTQRRLLCGGAWFIMSSMSLRQKLTVKQALCWVQLVLTHLSEGLPTQGSPPYQDYHWPRQDCHLPAKPGTQ